jgi:feruloyl esterase
MSMTGFPQRWFAVLALAAFLQPLHAEAAAVDLDSRCAAAAQLHLPQTRITLAEAIHPAPEYVVPGTENTAVDRGGPLRIARPFCRVAGVVAPAIRFEVWLPLEGWNGRFQGLGLGAFSGAVPWTQMAAELARGYAVGGTDTGHQSSFIDAEWTQNGKRLDIARVGDWAHRGIHEMTVKSQAIVRAVYGEPAHYSYFVGCSSGGHQALTEAQRYPRDYDGILAGAPANYWTHLMASQLWYGLATRTDAATNLEAPIDKLPALHAAVLQACDERDGVRDGVIENPLSCPFDPAVLTCAGNDSASCLTSSQVVAAQKIYRGAAGVQRQKIFPGLAPGGEQGWRQMSAVQVPFAQTFYRYFVFQDRAWDYRGMQFERDVSVADRRVGKLVNSVSADLSAFQARGGRLLQYHGWSDPLISPYNSIDYRESVVASTRNKGQSGRVAIVNEFYRLFMLPGVAHCRGGDGPDSFDGLGALQRWVEQSQPPDRIDAVRVVGGRTVRSRPLCPYPHTARYLGTGSSDEAVNFRCE